MRNANDASDFTIEIIAKGAFVDDDPGFKTRYLVETTVFRVSAAALSEYPFGTAENRYYTYETEEEWQAYLKAREQKRETWKKKVADLLDIDTAICSLNVTQSLSEVFTAVAISSIARENVADEAFPRRELTSSRK